MLMDCKHFHDGRCKVVESMTGREYKVASSSCAICMKMQEPMADNCFTRKLAMGDIVQNGNVMSAPMTEQQFFSCQGDAVRDEIKKATDAVLGGRDAEEDYYAAVHASRLANTLNVTAGPGTELKKLVSWFATQKDGCKCKDREATMNRWGVQGCTKNIDKIVGWLQSEAKRRRMPHGRLMEAPMRALVKQAIARANRWLPEPTIEGDETFYVAITTAPRKEPTLLQCMATFRAAGFEPIIYAEPNSVKVANATTIQNKEKLGIWHNFLHSARHALANSEQPYIITAQDDIALHPDSRILVEEQVKYGPEHFNGFLSLYTPRHYARKYKTPGIHRIRTRSLWGACCLVWRREVLQEVVNHPITEKWIGAPVRTKSARKRIYERRRNDPSLVANSDTAIGRILNDLKRPMMFTMPSPAMHIARFSSISHGGNRGNRNCDPCANHGESLNLQLTGEIS